MKFNFDPLSMTPHKEINTKSESVFQHIRKQSQTVTTKCFGSSNGVSILLTGSAGA